MAIVVNLDVMLAKRKMRSKDLASQVGITEQNLSILKTGKAKAIRFSTLDSICQVLECQPADILEFVFDEVTEPEQVPEPQPESNQDLVAAQPELAAAPAPAAIEADIR